MGYHVEEEGEAELVVEKDSGDVVMEGCWYRSMDHDGLGVC